MGTGPYRFVRYAVDDRVELAAFNDYFGGRPRNEGVVLKIVPDDIMRGSRTAQGDDGHGRQRSDAGHRHQLEHDAPAAAESPGVDYQYSASTCGIRCCKDVRVRQAIAYAIDRHAIIDYLRRGLARPAAGSCRRASWAFDPDASRSRTIRLAPARCSTRRAIAIRTATAPRRACV